MLCDDVTIFSDSRRGGKRKSGILIQQELVGIGVKKEGMTMQTVLHFRTRRAFQIVTHHGSNVNIKHHEKHILINNEPVRRSRGLI